MTKRGSHPHRLVTCALVLATAFGCSSEPLDATEFGAGGSPAGNDGDPAHRATPVERNRKKVNVLFCDGHGEAMKLAEMDDLNGDGVVDNGYWNGLANADPTVR